MTDCSIQHMIEFLQIILGQMIEFCFYALVFGALFGAWNVFFSGRAGRTLCGSHRDTLALPRPLR